MMFLFSEIGFSNVVTKSVCFKLSKLVTSGKSLQTGSLFLLLKLQEVKAKKTVQKKIVCMLRMVVI